MLIRLAWRNLWRNQRRTLITAGAIFFSVFLAMITRSFQEGTWDRIIGSVVEQYTGYGQIHKKGYWEEKSLNNSMEMLTMDSLENPPGNLIDLIPRINAFALGSHGEQSRGAQIIGVHPEKENELTALADQVVEGDYLQNIGEKALLAGVDYARIMGLSVGDTLILLGQGYHGTTAVGKYELKGLVNFGNPELNKRLVYIPLKEAQYMFGMPKRVTAMVLRLEDSRDYMSTVESLRSQLDTANYEVMGWREMNPSLVQVVRADTAGMVIMLAVIYLVIAFGIFSTVLMMTVERKHEFAILLSIGMKRWRMQMMMFFETVFLSLIGILAGAIAALPVMHYFADNPISLGGDMAKFYEEYGFQAVIAFSTRSEILWMQVAIILGVILLVYIYPWNNLRKIHPVASKN